LLSLIDSGSVPIRYIDDVIVSIIEYANFMQAILENQG